MIVIIGCGPGHEDWIPPATYAAVKSCDVILGSARLANLFSMGDKEYHPLTGDLKQAIVVIRTTLIAGKTIGVLVSGDPGFYSLLSMITREFPDQNLKVYPGISSLQLAFARANIPWQDADFISVHGRDIKTIRPDFKKPMAILTGSDNTPQKIARMFLVKGLNPSISVGSSLGYENEVWFSMDAQNLAHDVRELKNSIVIVHPLKTPPEEKTRMGIPDHEFVRGDVPMTKAEIRVQVLAKACISPSDNVLDIGAGTGSISIEAAMFAKKGTVYAVESNTEAQKLILTNCRKFDVFNVELIPGWAPDVFSLIPPVDVCIIGGSKGRLVEIIDNAPLKEGGRLVITAVTLETAFNSLSLLNQKGYSAIETVSLQVVRWPQTSNLHLAQALNPVFIISAVKGGRE
ncbi:MAG: precorrin-6y C5,15-methyltransferase (decarboxylating) subunit CbiE [Desulfitobacterium hafniense]|nr:precorrin-6y C5,15-methyltransferase (decarboxylating) subunit CbiE [Desulfitobacterium hafniense]